MIIPDVAWMILPAVAVLREGFYSGFFLHISMDCTIFWVKIHVVFNLVSAFKNFTKVVTCVMKL